MKILLIHQSFVSGDEPGGTRHFEFAKAWVRAGHDVTIIASNLSYLSGRGASKKARLVTDECVDGLRIRRAWAPSVLHRSFVWRVIAFLTFMATSVIAGLGAGRPDVVIGTTPPIFQVPSALLVSWLRRCPFVLEVRDLWPDFSVELGILRNRTLIRIGLWFESWLYRRAASIVVNSPAYVAALVEKGVPPAGLHLVPNGVDPSMFDPTERGDAVRKRYGVDGKFVVTYAGALGMANDIQTILRAAERTAHEHDVVFVIAGDGKERASLEREATDRQLTNVRFIGVVPKSGMPGLLAASDVCVATLRDIPLFRTTYPNKVFDYMAAGRPTILAIGGVIREVLERAQGGIGVAPGDDGGLAEAVQALHVDEKRCSTMGRAARDYVVARFDRAKQAERFLELLVERERQCAPSRPRN